MGEIVNRMGEHEAKDLLNRIADIFQIGILVRDYPTILANVTNAANHEFCIKPPSQETINEAVKLPDGVLKHYIYEAARLVCDKCMDTGEVAATPGQPSDGTVVCEDCFDGG